MFKQLNLVVAPLICMSLPLAGLCAEQDYPNQRPMTSALIEATRDIGVLIEEGRGIEKGWRPYAAPQNPVPPSSLGGVIASGIATTIRSEINDYLASRRSIRAARQADAVVPARTLAPSLIAHLQAALSSAQAGTSPVSFREITSTAHLPEDPVDGALVISTSYTLAESGDALRVAAVVTMYRKDFPYRTPYKFAKVTPKPERGGPVYRNRFVYQSALLPISTDRGELDRLYRAKIHTLYADSSGHEPAPDSPEGRLMAKEIESIEDHKFSPDEIAIVLMDQWLADDGALLKSEIENAHAFIAKYLLVDLRRTSVPDFHGQDEELESIGETRSVLRVGARIDSGAYVSKPLYAGFMTSFGSASASSRDISPENRKVREWSFDH